MRKRLTVQVRASNGPLVRREQNGDNPSVPEHTNELEGLAPAAQTPRRLGEAIGRTEKSTETDQAIGGGTGNTCGRDERSESHVRGEDGAGDESSDTPDDNDGVTGLAIVHLGHPAGEGQNTITSNCEDQAGSGNDSNGGVEPKGDNANDVHENMSTLAQDDGVERNKGLRGTELHELVRGRLDR